MKLKQKDLFSSHNQRLNYKQKPSLLGPNLPPCYLQGPFNFKITSKLSTSSTHKQSYQYDLSKTYKKKKTRKFTLTFPEVGIEGMNYPVCPQ